MKITYMECIWIHQLKHWCNFPKLIDFCWYLHLRGTWQRREMTLRILFPIRPNQSLRAWPLWHPRIVPILFQFVWCRLERLHVTANFLYLHRSDVVSDFHCHTEAIWKKKFKCRIMKFNPVLYQKRSIASFMCAVKYQLKA